MICEKKLYGFGLQIPFLAGERRPNPYDQILQLFRIAIEGTDTGIPALIRYTASGQDARTARIIPFKLVYHWSEISCKLVREF